MAKELVSLTERRWIKENAVRQMGTIVKYEVMDIDKVVAKIMDERKNELMTPWVVIQPISPDMHKTPNRIATFQKDPLTGVLYGIPVSEDEFGNIRWQKIQLLDTLTLNLDRINDAKIWAVIRFHPDIQGSPWQNQNPYYKIYDPVEKARVERNEIESMKVAFDRVDMILTKPKEMVNFCRYLGEELMENSNYEIVRSRLLSSAKNDPYDFNKKWESKSRSYGEYFESARSLGIITNEIDKGFVYKGVGLGMSKEDVMKYLSQDSNIMNSISNELKEKDVVVKNVSKTIREALKSSESKSKEEVFEDEFK